MKKRCVISDSSNNRPRIFNGTNWYVAEDDELTYTSGNLISNLPTAISENQVNTTTGYKIGAYYYGEWKTPGNSWNTAPWDRLTQYGFEERVPLMGRFSDDQQYVIDTEIRQAYEFGIDFFAFDFYYSNDGSTFNEQTLINFKNSSNKSLMKMCLMAANHSTWPDTFSRWQTLIDYWITNYFNDSSYLKIDGKPVVIIFDPDNLAKRGQGMTPQKTTLALLTEARNRWIAAGGTGIHFVACQQPHAYWIGAGKYLETNGYDAISAYNYHYKYDGSIGYNWNGTYYNKSTSYNDRCSGWENAWDWIVKDSGKTIPYYLPICAGWDDRPWGTTTTDTLGAPLSKNYWNCSAEQSRFSTHIQKAKDLMDKYPTGTSKIGIIYAWNEYGEGGYIAPTKKYDHSLLETIKSGFGK